MKSESGEKKNMRKNTNSYLKIIILKNMILGNSLAVQWLGVSALTAGGLCSIPGWGTKIPQAVWYGQKKQQGLPWWRSA